MGDWVLNDNIDDEEEAAENALSTFTGREGTIYLIDAGKYVNDPDKSIVENEEQFRLCLECIEADLLKSILINPKDLVSVVFYNTVHNPPPCTTLTEGEDMSLVPNNCAVFIPLKPLSKELIQYFKNFRESDDFFDFGHKYGSSSESAFCDAIWLCSRLNIRCNYKLVFSKILLFTNNELPHLNATKEQQKAFVLAEDLRDNNINVDLVPMVDEFNMELFYKEFLCIISEEEPEQFRCNGPVEQRYLLLNRCYRANYKKSCLRHLNFELVGGVAMACDIYSFTRAAKKPNAVRMFRDTNEVIISKRIHYVDGLDPTNSGEVADRHVLPGELYKSQNIGGREIVFRPEEVVKMKSLQSPGLRLLGFKPLDKLRSRWMIKQCLFLYPNEKKTIGSTTLFRALWQKCLEKQKYALCTLTMTRSSSTKYVALVPQTEDAHGNDGFCIIHLPMETNIGVLDSVVNPLPPLSTEQVSIFESVCKKLAFKFRPDMFCNPSLQSFYTNLEALVYDESANEIEDLTLPEYSVQDPKIEPFLEDIEEQFGTEEVAAVSRAKRGNDGESSGTRPKAAKKDLSPTEIEEAIRNGRSEAVTVQHLKDFIQGRGSHASTKANKKALFDLAEKLIATN